ncbi:MAG TPA: family 10 glycosylhydrolase, partial [Tichowtungia sp.]|nr:family 10 glycosylhydrolase [Tichowtungia sp.]
REVYRNASSAEIKAHSTFSFDRVSLAAMKSSTSRRKWDEFRRESVSQVVRDLHSVFKKNRGPQTVVSASVLADFSDGYNQAFQDSRRWTKEGRVDWVVPMNYNAGLFNKRLEQMKDSLGRRRTARQLVNGINCAADVNEIRRQIAASRAAGCRGVALFAYSHLFKNHQPTAKAAVLRR